MGMALTKVNALQIRQSLGKILEKLHKDGEPIIVEKGREAVAVLISIKTFRERFLDYREKQKRDEILRRFQSTGEIAKESSLDVLRELRYGSNC